MRLLQRTWLIAMAGLTAAACAEFRDGASSDGAVTYIERLGTDTFAIETFSRTPAGVEGRVVVRSPETRVLRYRAAMADGRVTHYELEWQLPTGDAEHLGSYRTLSRTTVSLSGDSALVRKLEGDTVGEHRVWAPAGVIPIPGRIPPPPMLAWSPISAWLMATERVRSSTEPLRVLSLDPEPPRTITRPAMSWGRDSVGLRVISGWTVAQLEPSGGIASISGRGTTVAVEIERADQVNLDSLAVVYAAQDARGEGIGYPSPLTRMSASIAGATLKVVYGRPSVRGRRIWGGLVPYDEVWRTGANPATHLTIDRDLRLGSVQLAAGSYTLWSQIEPSEAWLIVNRQTGQWGTQYDPEHDLAWIPMEREELEESLELFTIDIRTFDAVPDKGQLRLAWDRTRFTVPIRVP